MLQKLYKSDNLSKQFAILVCLQPLIDIYRIFIGNRFEIAGISVVELINMVLIAYLALLFLLNKRSWKSFAPAIVYGVILCVYLAAHCYNMLQFDTSIIEGTTVSVVVELYVIIRAYVFPVMLLYMMLAVKTEKNLFLNTAAAVSVFISAVIVVTNLLKVSFISYASNLEENEMIRQNIIEWFTKKPPEDLNLITSKGWFYSGNQIGLILFMLFPVLIYWVLKQKKKLLYLLIVLQVIAMIMVATKTAAVGGLIILGIMTGLLGVFGIVEKRWKEYLKKVAALVVILAGGALLLKSSPVSMMMNLQGLSYNQSQEEEDLEEEMAQFSEGELNVKEFAEFLNKYYYIYGIQEEYIKLFPVEKYPQFWLSVISDENKSQINFRNFKKRIYVEVEKLNDNAKDEFFGIGYTTNFPYLEKDISAQNVWFGKMGTVLLIGPYLLVFLIAALGILRRFKKKFTLYNCTLGLSICSGLGGSLLAGHLFGYFFPVIIFAYILMQLFHSVMDVD